MSWKSCLVVFLLAFTLVVPACNKKTVVTNTPTGVSSAVVMNWYTAVGVTGTIAKTGKDLTDTLILLNRNGVFPDGPQYAGTLEAVGRIAQAGLRADAALRSAPNSFGKPQKDVLLELGQDVSRELQTAQGMAMIGVKTPQAQASVQNFFKIIQSSLLLAENLSK